MAVCGFGVVRFGVWLESERKARTSEWPNGWAEWRAINSTPFSRFD
jgi:hypothetical protein